jgi:rhodanese-related sulfurtransferase
MKLSAVGALALLLVLQAPLARAQDLSAAPRITQAEFKKLRAAGHLFVVDVRDGGSYFDAHIPGAVNIPLNTIDQRIEEFKAQKKAIVVYCA